MNNIAIGTNVINTEPYTIKIEVPGISANLTITEHEFNLIKLCLSACQNMGYLNPPLVNDEFSGTSKVIFSNN